MFDFINSLELYLHGFLGYWGYKKTWMLTNPRTSCMVIAGQVPWEHSPNTNLVAREAALQGHRKRDHIRRYPALWSKECHCPSAGQMLLHLTGEYPAAWKPLGNVLEHKEVSILSENSNYLTNKDSLWKAQTAQLEMHRTRGWFGAL